MYMTNTTIELTHCFQQRRAAKKRSSEVFMKQRPIMSLRTPPPSSIPRQPVSRKKTWLTNETTHPTPVPNTDVLRGSVLVFEARAKFTTACRSKLCCDLAAFAQSEFTVGGPLLVA